MRISTIISMGVLLSSQPVFAADGVFSFTTGLDYSSGDYGNSQDTDVWAIPFSVKYKADKWNVRVSTSYLRVTSPSFVTPEGDFVGTGITRRVTEEGIGDVSIAGTYNLLDDRDYFVGLDVTARVKIPTADEDKFLGTGKTDYGLNAEIFKPIGNWTPYWNVGYRWRGDPSGFNLKNVWSSGIGTDYYINDNWSVGGSYDWQQKTNKFVNNAQETSAYVNYRINDNNKVNLYLLNGYSDSSPNFGGGVLLTHFFR